MMTLSIIEERLATAPFVPFAIHLADGRFFHIDHPDFVGLLRASQTLLVHFAPRHIAYVDVGGIITVETSEIEESR